MVKSFLEGSGNRFQWYDVGALWCDESDASSSVRSGWVMWCEMKSMCWLVGRVLLMIGDGL